jgi:cysteinyl-tRNA synthetase
MTLTLYNTLTKHLDTFTPQEPTKVKLYTCGPTVYDYPHLGNWAAYIYWDTLVRTLSANGYQVEHVMNITDVGHLTSDNDGGEDKLQKSAKRNHKTAWQIAEFYTEDFLKGSELLNLTTPMYIARATNFIEQQLELVRVLKQKGYTYQLDDGIYFDITKFPTYADFAGLDLKNQKAGLRVKLNKQKHHPSDFALWKFSSPNEKRDMEWETPTDLLEPEVDHVIMGFPGWHLECSAIAMSFFGETLDIHAGGIDHIPVHHTNEIAQSEAATGQRFSNYWLHNDHITINGTKISKSLGNGYTLSNLKEHGFEPLDFRMFILQSHYKSESNFTFDNLQSAHNRLKNWRNTSVLRHQTQNTLTGDKEKGENNETVSLRATSQVIIEVLNNDLNTPEALKIIDEAFVLLNKTSLNKIHHQPFIQLLETIDATLGLKLIETTPDISDETKQLIIKRQRARDNQDWSAADKIRAKLIKSGIVLHDTTDGVVWQYL